MQVSRRSFLKYCGASAAALGLGRTAFAALVEALRNPNGPTVLWLQGAGCSGCSVSFLNHISATAPYDAADVLVNVINLAYHPTIMAAAGQTAVDAVSDAYAAGGYLLFVEGGVPTAFNGNACWAWSDGGVDVTLREAVTTLAPRAAKIVCVGTCAAFGGIPAAPPNPAAIQSVAQVTGLSTINVAGCPPHPNWIVYVIAQLVAGQSIPLDTSGRPTALYGSTIHSACPLRGTSLATSWAQTSNCKEGLGCRGRSTRGLCPNQLFNGGVNWCVGSGSLCMGCTNSTFPGTQAFFT